IEVSSSLLLADAALLLVDAVEGPCARTHSLLREAHARDLVPILVVNKLDRLCTELGLSPEEAYLRIRNLIETVNAVCAAMVQNRAFEEEENATTTSSADRQEAVWNFDPVRGNVVFASALHGWGFTVPALARSLFKSKTVPIKPPLLRQYLFGDYKYKHDAAKVFKWKHGHDEEPMFAEFGLRPLWDVYQNVSTAACSLGIQSELFSDGRYAPCSYNGTPAANGKTSENKQISATTSGMDRVLSCIQVGSTSPSVFSTTQSTTPSTTNNNNNNNNNNSDGETIPHNTREMQQLLARTGASTETTVLSTILRRYRPLSDAVLEAACDIGPSPAEAANKYRRTALSLRAPQSMPESVRAEFNKIHDAVRRCDASNEAPAVAHVCKFASVSRFSVADSNLPSASMQNADVGPANLIMGIARVLSGTLRTDSVEYYAFGPKYDWSAQAKDTVPKQRIRCYLLMGSSFVKVDCVPAGHVCAIYNLEHLQLKTVTLCDRLECMPLRGFDFGLQPLVKVNVEPVLASGELESISYIA
ncbi:hypothetical protein ACHAWX_002718, partial [Stephanocyclus meneghinianus]